MSDDANAMILAAMKAVADAAGPLQEVVESPLFRTCAPGSVAVWALNKGFELTADQVRALANAPELLMLALAVPASEARH